MYRFFKITAFVFLSVFALSACGTSRPSTFYALDCATPSTQTKQLKNAQLPVLGIESVSLPPYLDKPQVLVRHADSPVVSVNEFHRWAELISDAFPRILATSINEKAKKTLAKTTGPLRDAFPYRLYIDINRFDSVSGGNAVLESWVTITDDQSHPLIMEKVTLTEPAGTSFETMVAAQNKLIRRLGHLIANYAVKNLKK